MARIFLTGATGMVGSALVPALLERGHTVTCLVRDAQRARTHFSDLEGYSGLRFVQGDVTKRNCGLTPGQMGHLRADKFVHGAASTRFEDPDGEVRRINVDGTRHALDLASMLGVSEFHYLSTAYVAGGATYFTETDLNRGRPRNAYEESKRDAECMVHAWQKGKTRVYRLGIVVGDSRTAKTAAFSGYYGFFLGFFKLRRYLGLQWQKPRKRQELMGQGFSRREDGSWEIPLTNPCSPDTTLNLVPVDWVVDVVSYIISRNTKRVRERYHIVHPNPPKVDFVFRTSLELLGFNMVEPNGNPISERVQDQIARFNLYVSHEATFGMRAVSRLGFEPPREITREFLAELLAFAEAHNFGERRVNT